MVASILERGRTGKFLESFYEGAVVIVAAVQGNLKNALRSTLERFNGVEHSHLLYKPVGGHVQLLFEHPHKMAFGNAAKLRKSSDGNVVSEVLRDMVNRWQQTVQFGLLAPDIIQQFVNRH